MNIKGVLFDLDGTLVDTAPDLVQVLNRLLTTRNLPPSPFAIARNEVSNGALGLIRLGFQQEKSEAKIDNLRQEFLELYTQNPSKNSKIFSGLNEVLINLEKQDIPWGIVTNKPHSMTEPLLKTLGLLSRAGCVVSGDRIPERKPHPAPVLLGAKELGIPSKYCVYVGDAPRDIEAGRAAGMPTIAASYGYIRAHNNPESWGASTIIRRPAELENALKYLNANYNFS
jgi:2-phosphoglycolate phosphatase